MGRKIKITESQYQTMLKEGVLPDPINVNANPEKYGGNAEKAINATKQNLNKVGVSKEAIDGGDVNVAVPSQNVKRNTQLGKDTMVVSNPDTTNNTTNEGRCITKRQLQENRLKFLKQNSTVYTVKDFVNGLKSK